MRAPDEPTQGLNRDALAAARDGEPPATERPLRIRDLRVIVTAREGINLVVVKVETEEPGLDGLGCAPFCYPHQAIRAGVEKRLRSPLIGRDAPLIEELQRLMHLDAYWQNGGVDRSALSGIDMALRDTKPKRAGMSSFTLSEARYAQRPASIAARTGPVPPRWCGKGVVADLRLRLRGSGWAEVGGGRPLEPADLPGSRGAPRALTYGGTPAGMVERSPPGEHTMAGVVP